MSVCLSLSFSRIAVEKCKRRWRMLRTDYVRWLNQAGQQRKGPKKAVYYLSEDLKFLNPHLSLAESVRHEHEDENENEYENEHDHDDRDSTELERDSKSRSKEPILEESSSSPSAAAYKAKPKETAEAVEERSQSGKELKPEEKKVKTKESETKAEEENASSLSLSSSLDAGGAAKKKPEFFIKQSNLNSPNCLIIGKKHAQSETPPPPASFDPLEPMADDSADETASVGGGRRLRRSATRSIKQLPIQKPAAEQRQTRLQRRKSMSIAAAHSLRSSTSPVKMTPLPRTSLAAAAAQSTATVPAPATTVAASKAATTSSTSTSSSTSSTTASPAALANNRDDIFPRPRAAAPLAQQLVLARRPGAVNPGQQSPTMPSPPVRHHIGPGRPPGPARVNTTPVLAKRAVAAPPQIGVRHAAPSVGQVAVAQSRTSSAASSAASSGGNTSSSSSSGIGSSSSSGSAASTGSVVNSTATPIASALASSSASSLASSLAKQLVERGSQTESADIFSDEHFLNMVRPQMREMNPRQKLHFKQKIFQALMETFDDATDFPGEGQAQHFNINTPSGFEHVSDPELRLMRELVSMVSAAKHTEKLQTAVGTSPQPLAGAVPAQRGPQQQQGNKIQTQVRIQRPPAGGTNLGAASVAGSTVLGEDKKLYRILQMNSQAKIRAMAALQRKESIDSNGSLGNVVPTRPGTFVVPANSPKTPTPSPNPSQTLRIQDPLMSLFGAGAAQVAGNKVASSKDPLQVRQMGRRYSVCGAGGPVNLSTVSGAPASASGGASSSSAASSGSPANAENAQLKRRMAPASQVAAPPQQRARYSHSPVANNQLAGIAPGNSLLVRRAAAAGAQKQPSPTGAGPVPQKGPQISNSQGSSGSGAAASAFNAFATPTSLRGSNSSLNNASVAAVPSGVSPLKRGMVIANVKGAAQQQKQSPAAATAAVAVRSPVPQMKPTAAPSSSNVANLLADARPVQGYARTQPAPARAAGGRQSTGESETAGIIAADDFDMSRLKREPQDIMDDDILGM